jgi:hypothetical protein
MSRAEDFNRFRFAGLHHKDLSNKYFTMNRVSDDETKIVVRIDAGHLLQTKYGYALILDDKHVVFIKEWAVSDSYYGTEVLLSKDYFTVKEWGDFPDYAENDQNLSWEHWLETAKLQAEYGTEYEQDRRVRWKK